MAARAAEGRAGPAGRAALVAFVLAELAGLGVYVTIARRAWFFGVFGDEWDFLARRHLSVHDLLLRHGDHLVALPALAFRLLFAAVGLRTYLPYQLLAIALHLTAAALLRTVMRRAGVHPWIATAAAALFALFGAGSQDILVAFQVTFTGALVLGLAQLLLADHEGPMDRRDAYALAAGLGCLLCSDVSIAMISAVGIAALLRGRWRVAIAQTAPLAVLYVAWSAAFGRTARFNLRGSDFSRSLRTSLGSTFAALGQVRYFGWVIGAAFVAGLVVLGRDALRTRIRARADPLAAPLGLAAGALVFAALLAGTRFGLGPRFAASSRYLHVLAALLLPAIAVAVDALGRRRRALLAGAVAVFLVGIPGNIARTGDNLAPGVRYRDERRVITSLARYPLARSAPRGLHPAPSFAAEVTVGWLLDNARSGRIPAGPAPNALQRATDVLRLSIDQTDGRRYATCRPLRQPADRTLPAGGLLRIRGSVLVQSVRGARPASSPLPFGTSLLSTVRTHVLRAATGPLHLRISPASPAAALC